jgi:hypothetical protein
MLRLMKDDIFGCKLEAAVLIDQLADAAAG